MSDEIELNPNQQELLNLIRSKEDVRERSEVSRGYPTPTEHEISGTFSDNEGLHRNTRQSSVNGEPAHKGSASAKRASDGHGTRSRPPVTTGVNPSESDDRNSKRLDESAVTLDNYDNYRDDNVTDIRSRELNAQRQQRHRDRQKQAQTGGVTVTENVTPKFSLKNILKPGPYERNTSKEPKQEVKLITSKEADDLVENLAYLYQHGSGLLDNVIEIMVKDHEPVSIWQLDEEEATTLATMHLQKGRVDRQAAQSARKLLEMYDKLFFIMLLGPRCVATGKHIIEHGGMSFK